LVNFLCILSEINQMKYLIIIILLFGLFSCNNATTIRQNEELSCFNDTIGVKEAMIFEAMTESFDQFLRLNFSNQSNQQDRMVAFLKHIQKVDNWYNPNWIVDTEQNQKLLTKFEAIGLRKEIRYYGYEEVELFGEPDEEYQFGGIPKMDDCKDSSSHFNQIGLFLYALSTCGSSDSLIKAYFRVRNGVGNIEYQSLAGGLLEKNIRYDHPIHRRILIVDFYLDIMYGDLERKSLKYR